MQRQGDRRAVGFHETLYARLDLLSVQWGTARVPSLAERFHPVARPRGQHLAPVEGHGFSALGVGADGCIWQGAGLVPHRHLSATFRARQQL